MSSLTPYDWHLPPASGGTTKQAGTHDLVRILETLRRRWRLFAAVVLSFVILIAICTMLVPKTYTTTARLIAGTPGGASSSSSTALPILNALVLQSGAQSAETFATLAQQENVAEGVVQSLHLKASPLSLLAHVSVAPVTNTGILNLSFSWRNPAGSAKLANAFAEAFVAKERDFVRAQALSAISFLKKELPGAQAQQQRAEGELAAFQASNGFVDANAHTQDIVAKATSIESKTEALVLDQREATALLNDVSAQIAQMPATINNLQQISVNPLLTDLQTKLNQVDQQLAQAQEQYTDSHPLVVSLKKQHDAIAQQIAHQPAQINNQNNYAPNPLYQSLQQQAAQFRERIQGDEGQLEILRRQRAAMTPILHQLPSQSMRLAMLQQNAKLAADVYNALQQKYNDAQVAASTAISDISIVQRANADAAVMRPNYRVNLLAGLIVGLLLGAIVVFCAERLQNTVEETDGSRVLGLPVMARIPLMEMSNQRMLPWLQSMTMEAFFQLCVSLKLKSRKALRSLAVTSPSRSDGKSTIAFHLATAMSRIEPRILLIDADLRMPCLHVLASCNNLRGLADVLQGTACFHSALQRVSPSLDLLAAGRCSEAPVALMQSQAFSDMLREACELYNMVIIDTPALSCVTDGFLVTAKTDSSLLVVTAHSTTQRETQDVVSRLAELGINNLLGVVLNRDRKRMADYSDYFVARTPGATLPGSSL